MVSRFSETIMHHVRDTLLLLRGSIPCLMRKREFCPVTNVIVRTHKGKEHALVTLFVPSLIACFASSPGRISLTAV